MPYIVDYDNVEKYIIEKYDFGHCDYILNHIIDNDGNTIKKYTCISTKIDNKNDNSIKKSIKDFLSGIDVINNIV